MQGPNRHTHTLMQVHHHLRERCRPGKFSRGRGARTIRTSARMYVCQSEIMYALVFRHYSLMDTYPLEQPQNLKGFARIRTTEEVVEEVGQAAAAPRTPQGPGGKTALLVIDVQVWMALRSRFRKSFSDLDAHWLWLVRCWALLRPVLLCGRGRRGHARRGARRRRRGRWGVWAADQGDHGAQHRPAVAAEPSHGYVLALKKRFAPAERINVSSLSLSTDRQIYMRAQQGTRWSSRQSRA